MVRPRKYCLPVAVKAIFDAAALKPDTIRIYKDLWEEWESWCVANNINSLQATHTEYKKFTGQGKNLWCKSRHKQAHSAIAYVYRSIGKSTPTLPEHRLLTHDGIYRNWCPSPVAVAAFEATTSAARTIKTYKELWTEWEKWCDTSSVDPLDATIEDFQQFLADRSHHWGKGREGAVSTVIGHVYRFIDKPSPTQPLYQHPKWSPAASAAFASAGLMPSTIKNYGRCWVKWETWCEHHAIDPLNATHSDYRNFLADYNPTNSTIIVSAINCVYRSIGKLSPSKSPVLDQDTSPSPYATAAFEAAKLKPSTIQIYKRWWTEWQSWGESQDVDPADADNSDYLSFVDARQHSWTQTAPSSIHSSLACVYRYIGKTNPDNYIVKRRPTRSDPASLAAQAAFQAAGLAPSTIAGYKCAWTEWTRWCDSNDVDPLDASHDDYKLFTEARSPHWGKNRITMKGRSSSSLGCVYWSINKNSPAHPVRDLSIQTTAMSQRWYTRFRLWCEENKKTPIPSNPADVVEFLGKVAQSYAPYDIRLARGAISRRNQQAGYPDLKHQPELLSITANLADHYPPNHILSPKTIKNYDNHRKQWQKWCIQEHIDPLNATEDHICKYIHKLVERGFQTKTIRLYVRAIGGKNGVNPPIESAKIKEALAAIPETQPARPRSTISQQEVEEELQYILSRMSTLELWKDGPPAYVTPEQLTRIKRAMLAGQVTNNTIVGYIRSGWIPFKHWCATNGTTTEKAEPGDIIAFLCERADQISPAAANSAHNALSFCYNQIRPLDNPTTGHAVSIPLTGLRREKPKPPSQMDPITKTEMDRIRATAYEPKPKERGHQTRLRAATDVALISCMRDGMTRGSEMGDARWCHLEESSDGSGTLTIPFSKTDQLAEGAEVFFSIQTMNDIRTMLEFRRESGIEFNAEGRIFGVQTQTITARIKRVCKWAGLQGRYASHSPRVGMTQDLVAGNHPDSQIMHAARWKNPEMPGYYARNLKARRSAVAQYYGHDDTAAGVKINPLAAYGLFPAHRGETRVGY